MPSDPDPVDPSPSSSAGPRRPEGLVLQPFRALRYALPPEQLASVTSPPYDVVDDGGVTALEGRNPYGVVRLILPRGSGGGHDRYAEAAATLAQWQREGVLALDDVPALYVYEQRVGDHVQRGLLGALALTPPEDGVVLPHEDTMAGPVADRLALYTAAQADLEPVFLVYEGGGAASRAVEQADALPPLEDLVVEGEQHRLWALTDTEVLRAVAEDLRPRSALIADGHHRYAAYLRRQAARHAAGDGPGPWDAGLVLLVDSAASGPRVRAIHRVVAGVEADVLADRASGSLVVHDLDGDDLDSALLALEKAGQAGPAFLLVSGDGGTVRLLTDPDPQAVARSLPADRSDAWRGLDVTLLHQHLVPHVWGLRDDVEQVRFAHEVMEALHGARSTGGTAVLLNPTPVAAVAEVAAAGERMPRKSTLFTPKPRTGLVLRTYAS